MTITDKMFKNTDELLAAIPPTENGQWEFKSAAILSKDKRGEFLAELAKQVSAFANSGGGNLVLGLSDGSHQPEECSAVEGRQTFDDWLRIKVATSVEYKIQSFDVHRIPFSGDPTKSVYVIEVGDSPTAPHQSLSDKNYYWRVGNSSEKAPHFHLENLRNRTTKALLEITDIHFKGPSGNFSNKKGDMSAILKIEIKNCSMQSATNWGVHLKQHADFRVWKTESGNFFGDGFCIQGTVPTVLLPKQSEILNVRLHAQMEHDSWGRKKMFDRLFSHLCQRFTAIPVSQNAIGKEVEFPIDFGEAANRWCNDAIDSLEIRDFDNLELSQNFGRVK